MSLSAIAPTTVDQIKAEYPKVSSEKNTETKPMQEIMLFAQKAQFAPITPEAQATPKAKFEHVGAAVASVHTSPSLFTTNSEGRFVASTGFAHSTGVATALPSALSSPEENSKGQDKHDDGSPQYVSARKSRADIRFEQLGEPILGGIFSKC